MGFFKEKCCWIKLYRRRELFTSGIILLYQMVLI